MKKRKSRTVSELKRQRQVKNFVELSQDVFPMLRYLGPHLSCDPVLMGKLLRMAKAFMVKVGLKYPNYLYFVKILMRFDHIKPSN